MRPTHPKLLEIYDESMQEGGVPIALSSVRIASWYTVTTLKRLLSSHEPRTRQAAAWGLGLVGNEEHLQRLGPLLRDELRGVRSTADEARRSILVRTQSPWHRRCAQRIEDQLARSDWNAASELANQLVEETECRADAFMMRAWVRFSSQQLDWAAEDCKKTLAIDPFCYRACVALGQCFWHQNRDAAARECFYESVRIYPDWEPAHAALRMMHASRAVA